ncbi:hypothetical protein [Lactococcus allomyrinae]|uniref:Uncharacterized protein n=1 Tax=Lactococcus allomyrinae TaxID=2419773 RepID=A0A387BE40_9LACT|nr:hypothetical protein [Lactococcus allomyrinae]AYG00332.1 hypothetical protein D7I46_04040 [Lactococcus allomyrinae]
MNNNEKWKIEEAHDVAMRALNEAEERLDDYRQRFYQETAKLSDFVSNFYHHLPNTSSNSFYRNFEQTVEEYNWELRKKQQQIEEARDEEQRDFNRKLDN